jgi:hypothetical protein
MSPPSPPSAPARLALDQALKQYWKNLIGVAVFPPVFFIGIGVLRLPGLAFVPFFFAVSLLAAWPYFTKKAPYMFWIVAMGVWMASATASVMLLGLLAIFGIKAEG